MSLGNLGAVVQIVGVVVVAWGAWKTWREFAPGEGLLDPLAAGARDVWHRVAARLQRTWSRLRGAVAQHVIKAGVAEALAIANDARARIGYGPLPDDIGTDEAIALLDGRTQRLMDRLEDKTQRLDDRIAAVESSVDAVGRVLDSQVVRLDAQGRRVATGGVRLSLAGAVLVIIGLALQAWPA